MDPWEQDARERALRQQAGDELDRRSIAELLEARGLGKAAVLVAASEYRSIEVSSWDGGQYQAMFAVPARVYDHVDGPTRAALEAAARAVIGEEQFDGISISVRRPASEPGWEEAMARRLFDQHAPSADPGALLALLPAPADSTADAEPSTHHDYRDERS